jgi:subtilisin family serine protease
MSILFKTIVALNSRVFLTNRSLDRCFVDDAASAEDQQGHGTHVAGIVMSQGTAGWSSYQGAAKGIFTLYNVKVG